MPDSHTHEPQCREKRRALGLPYSKSGCDKCGSLIRNGWKCAEEAERPASLTLATTAHPTPYITLNGHHLSPDLVQTIAVALSSMDILNVSYLESQGIGQEVAAQFPAWARELLEMMGGHTPTRAPATNRLRQFVLAEVEHPVFGVNDEAVCALANDPDPSWWTPWEKTPAVSGQWFLWRDPENPDDIHADQVEPDPNGLIEVKHGCGLMFYPECQAAVFADDVREAIAKAEAGRRS